jgi:anti-sigma factor RsiW
MSCPAFETAIALYVGCDLPPDEARAVERHLQICAECAEWARCLEADRGRLSSRPPEAVQADYAAMRGRIRREITEHRLQRRWLTALLAAAAILVAVTMATSRRTPQSVTSPAAVAASVAQEPASVRSLTVTARQIRRKQIPREVRPPLPGLEAALQALAELEPSPPPSGSDSPVEMRIATRDPNVTIILLQEFNGDSQ